MGYARMPHKNMKLDNVQQHTLHAYLTTEFGIGYMAPTIIPLGSMLISYPINKDGSEGTVIVEYRFQEGDINLYWSSNMLYSRIQRIKEICIQHGFTDV